MNRQQFYQWMDDPLSLSAESTTALLELTREYPYFQTARILYLLNLKLMQDYHYDAELRRVAVLAADRARLRHWLILRDDKPSVFEAKPEKAVSDKDEAAEQFRQSQLKELEEQIRASLREIEENKSKLQQLLEEKRSIVEELDLQEEPEAASDEGSALRPLPKDHLLEAFIREKTDQAQGRANFFNPMESARKSIEDNDEILSETLARLVAAQGKKDKAIKIYQKLMLKYPQKSSYFAAQIEKLSKSS